jgi:diaminopimelate epimerase
MTEDNTLAKDNTDAVSTRSELALAKYEGLGNDFLVLVDLEGRREIDASLARLACDRHLGFGADGLLRGGPPPAGSSDEMTFELRNADGGEAEMSGNGLRCLVHAAIDSGAVKIGPGGTLGVLTPAGRREVQRARPGGRLDVGEHRDGGAQGRWPGR